MPDLGGWELVILAVVALVLFGGSKLADVGKNAGKAIREFKEETAAGRDREPPAVIPAAPEVAEAPVSNAATVAASSQQEAADVEEKAAGPAGA